MSLTISVFQPLTYQAIDSVFILFRDYPGDQALQAYLEQAIYEGLLSLPTFLAAFLLAAQSTELHNAATLSALCRIALQHHYATGIPTAFGSLISLDEPLARLFTTVTDAIKLLRTACTLPLPPFHTLPGEASELLCILLACVTDVTSMSPTQALECNMVMDELFQSDRVGSPVRNMLESFSIQLLLVVDTEDTKLVTSWETDPSHVGLGRGETELGSSSETDIAPCSLLLNHLVSMFSLFKRYLQPLIYFSIDLQ